MMKARLSVVAVAFAMLLGPVATAQAQALERQTLMVDGVERSYFLHKPTRLLASPPLLIALHGGGRSEGDEYAARNRYTEIANREGFLLVFPNGVDAQWNDGRGATFRGAPDNGAVDDVGFISALIDHLAQRHGVDTGRVFVEGSSNGGMMSQRLACALAGKITGVATVIAAMPANIYPNCRPSARLSMMLMNGTGDPWVPYDGGDVVPLGRPSGEIISTNDTIAFWAQHNGCVGQPSREALADRDPNDGSTVVVYAYPGCAEDTKTVLYQVINGGHSRPGMVGRVPTRLLGPKNEDIDASEVIWQFFASLPSSSAVK